MGGVVTHSALVVRDDCMRHTSRVMCSGEYDAMLTKAVIGATGAAATQ
jgi:hypothetical protein